MAERAGTGDTILSRAEVAELSAEEPMVPPRTPSFFAAHRPLVPRLPAGQAGLRRRNAHAPAIRSLAKPKWRNSARRNPWFPREPLLLRSAQTTRPAPPGRPSRPPATKRA